MNVYNRASVYESMRMCIVYMYLYKRGVRVAFLPTPTTVLAIDLETGRHRIRLTTSTAHHFARRILQRQSISAKKNKDARPRGYARAPPVKGYGISRYRYSGTGVDLGGA